jgi:shikimate kinase
MFDLQGLNIYLIGMMGAGKSSIGNLLAERVGYRFLDTDTSIEKIAKQPITEIFDTIGEGEFRQLETQVLAEVSAYTRLVVATGGGIVIKLENWNHLQQGLVIWLDPTIETIVERLKDDTTRPLRSKLEQIFVKRRDRYAEADIHIPIDSQQTPAEIVEKIIELIPTVLKAQVT